MPSPELFPHLISVIIPCYNHAHYLAKAIDSIIAQNHKQVEILVVDDGSKDRPKEITKSYSNVKYVRQSNSGPSAARNLGIKHSKGKYLVFLDADDWLLADALTINLEYLQQNEKAAFVSGAHVKVNQHKEIIEEVKIDIQENHYCHLLQKNYIGMHAAVMYQRWVFDSLSFDISLKFAEDYDLYLKITRKYPVIHHTHTIAVYHIHDQNASGDVPKMLDTTLKVLIRQQDCLVDKNEEMCLQNGLHIWKEYYGCSIYNNLLYKLYHTKKKAKKEELNAIKQHTSILYADYLEKKKWYLEEKRQLNKSTRKDYIKKLIPSLILKKLQGSNNQKDNIPSSGKINMGDFDRTTPFSKEFGYDRGGPIDRYYIENFLQNQSHFIRDRVLEIGDNEYTLRYGGTRISKSDILHIDEKNPKATFIGDLSNAPQLPSDSFDCIILTQTLQLIYNYKEAIQTCYRILKPGGTLLLTVPGISHIDKDEWKDFWLWSFTDNSIKKILSEVFAEEKITVHTYGNVLVATAFLFGMGLPEIKKEQMDERDPHYQVSITALAIK